MKVHCSLLCFDCFTFLAAKVSSLSMPRRREVRIHVVPSYAWSLALLKPSHKSSSSSYNLLAVLGCLFFSVCFFMRKNSFWLLAPRLDFSMCFFRLFLRSKHYLDSTKNQQIQEARQGLWEVYSQTSNPNVVSLPPEHFVSNSTSDFVVFPEFFGTFSFVDLLFSYFIQTVR